ncbi:methionyl-tRNA formyltransferase [Arcanobacterium hippocoleae]
MRIIFAGTPETAIPTLAALAEQHDIIGILTREPAPKGRKKVLTNSPVHDYALLKGYEVYTPRTLKNDSAAELIANLAPDAVAVVAYGLLIPENLLRIPKYGWINLHYSLLPRWRGASPVQAAIAAGDTEIGTCVFQIEKGLDTGNILSTARFPLDHNLTAGEVLTQLSESGAQQMLETFAQIESGTAVYREQTGESTYAHLLNSQIAQIDWQCSAAEVQSQIHAYIPEPGSWTSLNGMRMKIGAVKIKNSPSIMPASSHSAGSVYFVGKNVHVATGNGEVELTTISPAGKNG